ncbi:hypothetical protein AXG93_2818s1220 [Marchantia polymorpha subsp. ruderalis]|uniref:Costars domain-containing protein n=3 Tax=Marchantia polymorpha TaxID=3197 RepID=A0A176VXA0_MARPO|nr:hypothetical protein AXG93_2818s1220 [Marchantia polymorpha subsp. ruderalis]
MPTSPAPPGEATGSSHPHVGDLSGGAGWKRQNRREPEVGPRRTSLSSVGRETDVLRELQGSMCRAKCDHRARGPDARFLGSAAVGSAARPRRRAGRATSLKTLIARRATAGGSAAALELRRARSWGWCELFVVDCVHSLSFLVDRWLRDWSKSAAGGLILVRRGGGSLFEMTMNVSEEIERLKEEITRLGKPCPDGSISVKFGTLFNDDRCANLFEALVGTLRAAKKRKLVKFDGELLLQGVHDNVDVILLKA